MPNAIDPGVDAPLPEFPRYNAPPITVDPRLHKMMQKLIKQKMPRRNLKTLKRPFKIKKSKIV